MTYKLENKLDLDGHKLAWHKDRVEAWLNGELIAPISMDCAITRMCNHNCVFCLGQFRTNKKLLANEIKRMNKDVIYRFLDDAAEIGVKAISWVGDGENTCSPHFSDSIIRGKQNGLDIAVATNGVLLNKEILEQIMLSLTYIRFNVSGGEPERYQEIHRCKDGDFEKVCSNIEVAVKIKRDKKLETTIGLQMVLMPNFIDQAIPIAKLGLKLGVDYSVIKHCSDDEGHRLGVDYSKYFNFIDELKKAESFSTDDYLVKVKWSKVLSGGKRTYSKCYGPAFAIQLSGSGLIAPCGMLFTDKYKKFHMGNIADMSFKEIWKSERYKEVLDSLASGEFDARTMCGTLCLQHKINEYLSDLKEGKIRIMEPQGEKPIHINFI